MSESKTEPRCNFPGHRLAAIKAVVQDCLECGVTIVTPVNPYQPGVPAREWHTGVTSNKYSEQDRDDPRICKATAHWPQWSKDPHGHVWQTRHFQDEYPRDMCAYCGVDRGDVEHDAEIFDRTIAGNDAQTTKLTRLKDHE